MTDIPKVIFKSNRGSESMKIIVQKSIASIVCVISWTHFWENPIVISVLSVILIGYILLSEVPRIVVYKDKFVLYTDITIVNYYSKKVFYFNEIKNIYYPVDFSIDNLPARKRYLNEIDPRRKFYVVYKDGSSKIYSSIIPIADMQTTFRVILGVFNKEMVNN